MNSSPTPDLPDFLPVDHCPSCGLVIDVGSLEPLTEVECPDCNAVFPIQSQLGHFKLLKIAGKGGMGVVYRAFDSELNREVALKLLKREQSADPSFVEKLDAEATITASVNHPNVVRVFSTGMANGRFYIAMELVDKGSLEHLIKIQGTVSEAQTLLVGIQAAAGLRAAQEHGLIHRDIKPANILFATPSLSKLVDFGLAISQSEEESVRGEIWGTPYYIAPEKIEGNPEDFRSDIYSLGGTLFHAITGRPPFDGPDASTIALKHLQSAPLRIQSFAPHISKRTAYVIDRMLHKNPEQRYQSYDELIEHLQYARNELLQPENGAKKAKPLVVEAPEENRAATWFTAAALLILVVGFLFRGFLFPQATPSKPTPEKTPASLLQAQAELESGAYTKAVQTLLKTIDEPKISDASRLKALFLLSCIETFTETATAKAHLSRLRELASKTAPEKSALAPVLAASASILLPGSQPPPLSASDIKRGDIQSILLFATGLREWSGGSVETASTYFRDFRLRAPTKEDDWMQTLSEFGNQIADSFESFRVLETQFRTSSNPWEKANLAAALQDFPEPLATRVSKIPQITTVPVERKPLTALRRETRFFQLLDAPSELWMPTSGFWAYQNQSLRGTQPPNSAEPARSSYRKVTAQALNNTELLAPIKARTVRFHIHRTNVLPVALDEFEVFDSSGKNVALASEGAIASASGSAVGKANDQEPDKYAPAKAIDGIFGNSSIWVADKSPAWFQLDFAEEKEIQRIVWSRDREEKFADRVPLHYEILSGNAATPLVAIVRASEAPPTLDLGDFVVEWSFAFSDAKSVSLRFEEMDTVLFQTKFAPNSVSLEVEPGSPSAVVPLTAALEFKPNTWHVCTLEVIGSEATLSVDGKRIGTTSNKTFSKVKSCLSFEVSGGSADFKKLTVWGAVPMPDHLLPEDLQSARKPQKP